MQAEVKILIQGFTNADSVGETGEERTQPTITLVRDEGLIIVVDPGVMRNRQMMIDALAKEDLKLEDVNMVFITHSHIDHYRNVGMFPNAKVLDFYGLWDEDTVEEWNESFTTNIQILRTPGHDYTGLTFFVNTAVGVVAICGDIFWRDNYPERPQDDEFASDSDKLAESRKEVLKMADWIVPGHGGMYRSEKELADKPVDATKKRKPKIVVSCKKCGKPMKEGDSCTCRPWLCFRDCECGFDCEFCGCSHKR